MRGPPAPDATDVAPRRPFAVRAVVADGIGVWARDGGALFLAAILFCAPTLALALASGPSDAVPPLLALTGHLLLTFVLGLAQAAAVAAGALASWRGERRRAGALALEGIRLLPRALATAPWGAVAAFAAVELTNVVAIRAGLRPDPLGVDAVFFALTAAGATAVLVASSALYVALPAAVAEPGRGAFSALARSIALTRGRRLHVSGLGLLTIVVLAILGVTATLRRTTRGDSVELFVAFELIASVVNGACVTIAAAAYRALRIEKEGASVVALGDVFD